MASEKLVCVICRKDNEKVIVFNEKTLKKSYEMLEIRKKHGLKYKDVILPNNINLTDGYHTQCYKNFLALMKKYYVLSSPSDISSTNENSLRQITCESPTIPTIPDIVDVSDEEAVYIIPDKLSSRLKENILKHSKETQNQNMCIFCGKSSKKYKRLSQPLHVLDKETLKKSLVNYEKFIEDTEIYKKIQNTENLYNHRICRKVYFNKLREFHEKPITNYHINIQLHKEAFNEICSFINESVVKNKTFHSFTSICNNYIGIISKIASKNGGTYDNMFNTSHFENKLKKQYKDEIQITLIRNKKIIGPKGHLISNDVFTLIEEKDILQNAALILRRTLLSEKDECTTPQSIKDFYSTVLSGCQNSSECERKSTLLTEDLIAHYKNRKHDNVGIIHQIENASQLNYLEEDDTFEEIEEDVSENDQEQSEEHHSDKENQRKRKKLGDITFDFSSYCNEIRI